MSHDRITENKSENAQCDSENLPADDRSASHKFGRIEYFQHERGKYQNSENSYSGKQDPELQLFGHHLVHLDAIPDHFHQPGHEIYPHRSQYRSNIEIRDCPTGLVYSHGAHIKFRTEEYTRQIGCKRKYRTGQTETQPHHDKSFQLPLCFCPGRNNRLKRKLANIPPCRQCGGQTDNDQKQRNTLDPQKQNGQNRCDGPRKCSEYLTDGQFLNMP